MTKMTTEVLEDSESCPESRNGPGTNPNLKRIIGAMLLGAKEPVPASGFRAVIKKVAEAQGETTSVTDSDILSALHYLHTDLTDIDSGLIISETASGFRLVTDPECGIWVRTLLNLDRPSRLSRPALETLAIIAFRQPVTRPEIEAVRGVNVDSIMRNLIEAQLIKVMGRSELPGRPMLYGTTKLFLEHFGLNDLKDLPCMDELCRREEQRSANQNEKEEISQHESVRMEEENRSS